MGFKRSFTHGRHPGNLPGMLVATIFLIVITSSSAEDEFFLPNSLVQGDNRQHLDFSNLNNAQLLERARELRSQELNATQRALNYQWLESHQNHEFVEGSKAYKAFFKRGLKEFWNRQRKERFKSERVPDINGRGSISREVDYDLHLSSDELKIGLSYEF